MRIKAYLSTYILFLCILFISLGIVSVYMTNSQTNMLSEKSAREYQTISAAVARDIATLHRRNAGLFDIIFYESVDLLVSGYTQYYSNYNIEITLLNMSSEEQARDGSATAEAVFIRQDGEHFIYISGELPEPFSFYLLDYKTDITENITELQNIQRILLLLCIAFSIITAIALHYIMRSIFKPLGIVANTSRKIANGQFSERIDIKEKSELFSVANDFNTMADEIEKQMRMLEEEAVGKQQFIDNFAHEIRTPLTSIYGYAEYLQKTPFDTDELIESTQFIMDEANHMKKIANSLLELATLKNYELLKTNISIRQLFENIAQALKKTLNEEDVQLVCTNDADTLYGQEDLIKGLLMNLCLNAIKSCSKDAYGGLPPKDGGVVRLNAKKQGQSVVLSVADNGCGFSDEHAAKITEPFYRVDKSRSREQGGAGLGLTLCKQIAEAHEAKMQIESSTETGTTVKITFEKL